MNIEEFISLKNNSDALIINDQMTTFINMMSTNKKIYKDSGNKNNNILKNPKLQLLKDKTENKVNLVLNKLSELNVVPLVQEFIEMFGKIDEKDFKDIQKAFYIKIQMDINFVKIYLDFFKIISLIYERAYNLKATFFYDIVECKYYSDYNLVNLNENFKFLEEFEDEQKRLNNLIIIKTMINNKMLKNEIYKEASDNILKQNKYFADIYYWFQNEELSNETKTKIQDKILNNSLPLRDKVLLDNLIEKKDDKDNKVDKKVKIKVESISHVKTNIDTLHIEIENIIEEYLFMDSLNEVINFIFRYLLRYGFS